MAVVTVFGGTGFLGRRIVERIAADGATVRLAVRHPQRNPFASSDDGRFVAVQADIRDEATVAPAVAGAEGAVNAVSAYVEKGGVTYFDVHERGAANVARQCARQGVSRLVHISGIGADPAAASKYIRARGRGELTVREAFPNATIIRPSVMFGPDDAFLNKLAEIGRRAPVFVLIGGRTRMQPVHVADVAEAVRRVLAEPSSGGKTYELAGPRIYTLREIVDAILRRLELRRPKVPVPFWLSKNMARLAERLPGSPLTVAQVELLEMDNLPRPGAPGLQNLDIEPRSMEHEIEQLSSSSR
jgi:NADH dehydrogenase